MSFVDKVSVTVKAGDGGNGHVSFRHEKFIDKGGPDGGDGGRGGNVVLAASRNQNTLAAFRYQKKLLAEAGAPGGKQRKHGKSGVDLMVPVPVGTMILTQAGATLADLDEDGQQTIIAKGGRGGFGNAHFVSSTRQAPRIAEKGEPGEDFDVVFELKMIADVGLVGLPNAGKSTLLAVLSNAKPEIADYPFTTLTPNIGVVDIDENHSLLLADIPGLIEGAAEGKGLGDEFLRHLERTLVLVHLIDANNNDPATAYRIIQTELKAYKIDLSTRSQVVVLTKIEGLDEEIINDLMRQLKKVVARDTSVMAISAQAHQGLPQLLNAVSKLVETQLAKRSEKIIFHEQQLPVLRLEPSTDAWQVEARDGYYLVTGQKIEGFARRTDFNNPEAVGRLRNIMAKMGILHELDRQKVKPGDIISIHSIIHIKY